MFKEKVNARTDPRRTQDHDISPAGLWPVELKMNKAHSYNKCFQNRYSVGKRMYSRIDKQTAKVPVYGWRQLYVNNDEF